LARRSRRFPPELEAHYSKWSATGRLRVVALQVKTDAVFTELEKRPPTFGIDGCLQATITDEYAHTRAATIS
jgi:hypothetical protein